MSSINEVTKDYTEARSDARRKHRLIALLSCLVVLATAFSLMAPAISASKSDLENAGVGLSNAVEPESLEDVAAEADEDAGAADADDAAGGAGAAAEAPAEEPAASDAGDPAGGDHAADTPAEPAAPEQDLAADPADETLLPAQTFTGEVKNKKDQVVFSVLVDAPEGAFPEGTTMEINTLSKRDQKEAQQAAAEAVEEATDNKINRMESVDITFRDAEGNEVEPQQTVSMKFASVLMGKDFEPKVVHQDDQGEATVVDPLNNKELKKRDQQLEENELMVDVDAFSVYTIVYTVDFHYSVDGQSYDAQTQGGDTTSLKALLSDLGVAKDDEETVPDELAMFMESIANVEFSAPELVAVAAVDHDTTAGDLKAELGLEPEYAANLTEDDIAKMNAKGLYAGDWALVSLKPFESEETLTITMQDGQQFVVKVTDEQISKTVISASGDTYEITVTYGPEAGIPDGAELQVREIESTEKEFAQNVEATNKQLQAQGRSSVENPAQFDISIVSDGTEVEPKEGSVVNVEIKLAPNAFNANSDEIGDDAASLGAGEFWVYGKRAAVDDANRSEEDTLQCTVAHLTDDGTAEIIESVDYSTNESEQAVFVFETASFSDYLFDGASGSGLGNLPDMIYVGDEIYMWHQADMWVTNIGSVVTETKHPNGQYGNDGSDWKTVTAIKPGTFRIYYRYNQNQYKEITVQPARTGTTPPATIDTIDNSSIGLTLNLFDYDLDNYLDDYFNNYNHDDNPVPTNFLNHGINDGHNLKFWGSGIGNNHGTQNQYQQHGVTQIVGNELRNGYPVLRTGNTSLDYLFTPSDGTDKKAYTNVNGLFKKDGDYYVYDSNQNYAYYDTSQGNGGSFAVYNSTYNQKSGGERGAIQDKAIGFFPFHKWDDQYDLYVNWNKNLNHHFGMSMSVPFSLPKDPKAVVDTEGRPIVFEFSGDDDMWVFIDGKLAMDIGGIHQPTSGTINFQDQTVIVNGSRQTGFDFSNLYDGKKHTLQVFYIERGGADSNCMIKFNLTQYGHVEFDKADKDNQNDKLQGAVFGIYKDAACTQPLMENLKDNTSRAYVAESDANGHVKFSDIPLGSYYMKELHAPEGYPLDGTIHPVQVYLEGQEVKAKIDGVAVGADNGVTILNKKPSPIALGLKKDWQDADGHSISAPVDVTATFEIKRIRTYETYTEQQIEGQGRESSHLTVGWVHNGQTHVYNEYDLIAGSQATVSWSYVNGYEGSKACIENGNRIDKGYTTGDVVSEGLTMPAAGQSATFYIVDDSETGEAIKNINVAGQQFYGNSGGGVIHSFTTVVEPDPGFSYTGEHVAQNQVTLPIDSNVWQYDFRNLPTFEKVGDTVYNYSYYLEEVSSTSPAGTTIVYQDINENVINAPTGAETSQPGTQTIINKVPFGYLQIQKKVTYNGSDQNLTSAQKSKLAGVYKFKIYTKKGCAEEDAVKGSNGEDLEVAITIGSDGQAVSSDAIKLIAGTYWIKEVESSNPAMFPTDNPVEVTVTKDNTSTNAAIQTLTNNYDENNGPDKIALDIEKKFSGLGSSLQVPSSFQVVLQYTVGDQTKTVTLGNTELATGDNGEKITWTGNDLTWHWRVSNIPSEATDFKIKEQNYNTVKGYQWIKATLNNADITSSVDSWHDLVVTAPAATLSDVTHDRRTSDSGNNTEFYLEDDDILLTKLTANQGTLVISKHPLNMAERDAVQNGWPSNGGFKKPPHYFSIEEHPNGFSYGNKTITFGEKNGKATVKFTQNASAQEVVFAVTYSSQDARNNANLVNEYAEVPMTIDIVKVDKDNVTTKLSGAVFTLRQLADKGPTDNGTFETLDGTDPTDSTPTGADGKTSFANLTHGSYEVTEKTAPAGYVLNEQTTFYFKIDGGVVTWLQKGDGKPSTWQEATHQEGDMVSFAAAQEAADGADAKNATFTVGDEPGKPLPNTGGPGTALVYGLGAILVALAAVMLLRRRIAR